MAFWARMKNVFGCEEFSKNRDIWRMLMAEFVGPLFLVLIGCASCVEGWNEAYSPHIVQVALSFGVTIATMAQVQYLIFIIIIVDGIPEIVKLYLVLYYTTTWFGLDFLVFQNIVGLFFKQL